MTSFQCIFERCATDSRRCVSRSLWKIVGLTTDGFASQKACLDPGLQESVAPPKTERQVISSPQRHDGHQRRRLQLQLLYGLQQPCHSAVPTRCQNAQSAARMWVSPVLYTCGHKSKCEGLEESKCEGLEGSLAGIAVHLADLTKLP